MGLNWAEVTERYEVGTPLAPLSGNSKLTVASVDESRICLKQRLWQDCVTRSDLDRAMAVLGDRAGGCDAIMFAEEMRDLIATGPDAVTDCSRIPNLTAIVLRDLGYLT